MKKNANLVDKVFSLLKEVSFYLTALFEATLYLVGLVAIFIAFIAAAAKAPELHSKFIRSQVGSKVYVITNDERRGMGTGFAIKGASGETYIITNDHVCGVSSDGISVVLINNDGKALRRRILEQSKTTDLCVIEAPPGVSGLSLGSAPSIGQVVASVGHPSGYDLTFSRGEIIQIYDVSILEGPISQIMPDGQEVKTPPERGGVLEENCQDPKHRIIRQLVNLGFIQFESKMCIVTTKGAYGSNMLIQPGSSGSPVVNFWGNVVAVVFASDRAGWGSFVSFKDLQDLLSNY